MVVGRCLPSLLQNWIAGFINPEAFIPVYHIRDGTEEQMMLEQFREEYRSSMKKVGGIPQIPDLLFTRKPSKAFYNKNLI